MEPGGTNLAVEVIEPSDIAAKIETNILTAPGRPGSVDKGEREERGVRLAISTGKAVSKTRFAVKLRVKKK